WPSGEPQTRKRELAALNGVMEEYGFKSGMVVTRNEAERIKVVAGEIEVVPIWRFLLDLPEP
ncbi:MAG: ATP-binding protein, partial [Deltaproteobacteria bacterium]|nr:ATP-binding protein [Candidatus Tharpella sp.]